MKQIGTALMMYTQDYDETFPCIRFHEWSAEKGTFCYVWKNALRPYLKSLDVFGCPSNPLSRAIAGKPTPGTRPPEPGENAEGWEMEPSQRMPISYGMNSCAASLYPADNPQAGPPLRYAQLVRAADTIVIAESPQVFADVSPVWLWQDCPSVFTHSAGKVGNFIFADGHVKTKKWLSTFYPLPENNWELSPNPDPSNRQLGGVSGCEGPVPSGPSAREFQTKECQAYQ
jgi:prepilin-type processing-associated H-X9-DG protein